jgi:hypothetical protein
MAIHDNSEKGGALHFGDNFPQVPGVGNRSGTKSYSIVPMSYLIGRSGGSWGFLVVVLWRTEL